MYDEILRIEGKEYRKTPNRVFEIPIGELRSTRFVDIPFYSTVEIGNLPGSPDLYRLSISATHGGGPTNEDFWIHYSVAFSQPKDGPGTSANTCTRKLERIRRLFKPLVESRIIEDGDEIRLQSDDRWHSSIIYAKSFTREENPILQEVIRPIIERFTELLAAKDILLFICHASEDKAFVDMVASCIDRRGIDLWYDKREIKVGQSIVERINEGLGRASHLVVVLSNVSTTKSWVQRELSSSLMRQLGVQPRYV